MLGEETIPPKKMVWDSGLEGVHREIAADSRSPIHVLAGPGTGKTFAVMRRIARLLEEGIPPKRILAATFTRTAARDLREQLAQLGAKGVEEVQASTLHSLCFGALLADAVFDATGRKARPLMQFEIGELINDLKDEFGGKREVRALMEAYEAAWARLQHEAVGTPKSQRDQRFEIALIDWLRYHRAMLIGELVPITLRFLQQNPEAPVLEPYGAVLVDEYQDLNKADQTLVEFLSRAAKLTVIGDDNQSIYRFRHANPEGIRVFPAEHPGTAEYVIQESRRCPPNIVAMSNALIAHDPTTSRPSPLAPEPGRPDASVYVVQHPSLADEADSIAAFVEQYFKNNSGVPAGQVLVLSPRRAIGNGIRDALIRRRLNSMSFFFEDALDTEDAAEGFCLVSLAVNPGDRASYRAWIGLRHDSGHSGAYARIRKAAEKAGIEPMEVVEGIAQGAIRIPHSAGIVERHNRLKERLKGIDGLKGLELVDALWSADAPHAMTVRLAAQNLAISYPEPGDLLEQLRDVILRPELPDSKADIVRVMSLHKSKGLTAKVVIVVGCMGGAIPTSDSSLPTAAQDALFNEQRRLFYVAITRATDTLVLSSVTTLPMALAKKAGIWAASVFRRDGELFVRTAASPFISELGSAAPATITGAAWRGALGF